MSVQLSRAVERSLPAVSGQEAPSAKLLKSAREFEAILLQSWLEKINQSFVGSSESQDPAHDTVSSLGTQAIATALAARGGIGIAHMLLTRLGAVKTSEQTDSEAEPRQHADVSAPLAEGAGRNLE